MDTLLLITLVLIIVGFIGMVMAVFGLVGTLPRLWFGVVMGLVFLAGIGIGIVVYVIPASAAAASSLSFSSTLTGAIGLLLLVVGMTLFLAGAISLGSGRSRGYQQAVAGVLLTVVGVMLGGLAFLGVLLTPVAAPSPTPGAMWDVAIKSASTNPAVSAYQISPDAKSASIFGSRSQMEALQTTTLAISVVNLNTGSSTTQYQFVATHGTIAVVVDPTTGTSAPIASSVSWSGHGTQVNDKYYDTLPASGTTTVTAVINMDGSAFTNAQVGTPYTVDLSVAGKTLAINFFVTG